MTRLPTFCARKVNTPWRLQKVAASRAAQALIDLDSNNGTVLARPGMSPVLLATSLPTPLFVGDLLDVGDGVTLQIDPPL